MSPGESSAGHLGRAAIAAQRLAVDQDLIRGRAAADRPPNFDRVELDRGVVSGPTGSIGFAGRGGVEADTEGRRLAVGALRAARQQARCDRSRGRTRVPTRSGGRRGARADPKACVGASEGEGSAAAAQRVVHRRVGRTDRRRRAIDHILVEVDRGSTVAILVRARSANAAMRSSRTHHQGLRRERLLPKRGQ